MLKKILCCTALTSFVLASSLGGCSSNKSDNAVNGAAGRAGSGGSGFMLDSGNPDGMSSGGMAGDPGADKCPQFAQLGSCGATTVEAKYTTANIMLVIDKSGSMTDQPMGFDVNKWDALQQSLNTALTNVAGELNFGLILYPYSTTAPIPEFCDTGCCEVPIGGAAVNVPIEAGATSVPKILDVISKTSPGGGTPTAAGLARALEYYTNGAGKSLTGEKYVLLATDGGPNCNAGNSCDPTRCTTNLDGQCTAATNCCDGDGSFCLDDQAVVSQIAALKSAGISTFVVGIPGTEAYSQYLDQFAQAGGVTNPNAPPSYYAVSAMGGVQGLVDTFTSITTHLVRSCEVDLASQPARLDLVNVAVDCEIVPYQDGAGWSVSIDDGGQGSTVLLKGDACDFIQNTGARRVDVVYGCKTLR